ncbi:MAG: putative membrane protein [Inoviridae sp.]|nr:MAG: putative membrane protein [Inoviridae sp.]
MSLNLKQRFATLNRKNIATYGTGAVVSTALMSSNANALDVTAALAGTQAKDNIETGGLWVLGIVVLIYGTKKVIGFFGR